MGSPPPDENKIMKVLNLSQPYWGSRVTENAAGMWFLKTSENHPMKFRCDKAARELITRGWAVKEGALSQLRPTDDGIKILTAAGLLR